MVFGRAEKKIASHRVHRCVGRSVCRLFFADRPHRGASGGGGSGTACGLHGRRFSARVVDPHPACVRAGRPCRMEARGCVPDVSGAGHPDGVAHRPVEPALLPQTGRTGDRGGDQPVDCFFVSVGVGLFGLWLLRRHHRHGGRCERKPDLHALNAFSCRPFPKQEGAEASCDRAEASRSPP